MDNAVPHRCQMILVEDSMIDARLLLTLISHQKIDIEVQHIIDGRSAYNHLKTLISEAPTEAIGRLVLLDLNLPNMSGKEILKRLNAQGGTPTIPILVFSSSDNQVDKDECLAMGAKNYYVKPWDLDGYQSFIMGPFLRELREVCPCL